MDDHPNADDYRNRAEAAEQRAAEAEALADRLAATLGWIEKYGSLHTGPGYSCAMLARDALAAHTAARSR